VASVAQATKAEIREHCKAQGIPTPAYQRGMARVHDQLKLTTEVTREDGSKAYQLRRQGLSLSVAEYSAMIEEVKSPAKPREKYDQGFEVRGVLVLDSPALGSRAVEGNPSARVFARTADERVLLFPGYFQAMAERALQMPGVADGISTAVRFQCHWDQQALPLSLLGKTLNPVPPDRHGAAGKGLTDVEILPAGTRVPFCVTVPGSHVTPMDMATLLIAAGRWVGFSPAAAHLGWGRFTVELDDVSRERVQQQAAAEA
jgi:hypothetical protein